MNFDRAAFSAWYDGYLQSYLLPGRSQITRALEEMLDTSFKSRLRDRYRLGIPRIKSANRTYSKIGADKYESTISTPSDTPKAIDDLLGVRIVCTNLSDVFVLRDALMEYFPSTSFRGTVGDGRDPFAVEEGSLRDYIAEAPKESGYRAFHLNLITQVAKPAGGWEVIRCEIQIRTLLQESWGELTHEDTYKPGGEVTEFVSTLSRRMAEVLAVMDDLAQDLRTELDRQIDESIDDLEGQATPESETAAPGPPEVEPRVDGTAAEEMLPAVRTFVEERYRELKEPLSLASLAWELRQEFGPPLTDDWLGYKKMAPLLQVLLPTGAVVTSVPGILVPAGYRPSDAVSAGSARVRMKLPEGVPEVARSMKAFDPSFPLRSHEELSRAYEYIATAHERLRSRHERVDPKYVNVMTKAARDLAASDGREISRALFSYIGTALRFGGKLDEQLSAEQVAAHYADFVVNRFVTLGLGEDGPTGEGAQQIRKWLVDG